MNTSGRIPAASFPKMLLAMGLLALAVAAGCGGGSSPIVAPPGGETAWAGASEAETVAPAEINPALAAPRLIAPPNGATGVSRSPTLQWTAVEGATFYRLQVALDLGFRQLVFGRPVEGTQFRLEALPTGTELRWRVAAGNSQGCGPWSEVWRFTTEGQPLPAPILLQPENGVTNVSRTPTLRWHPVPGATHYVVQVAKTDGFREFLVIREVAETQVTLPLLPPGTTIWWRVRAFKVGAVSPWSLPWRFTTEGHPLAAPTLLAPPNGATGVARRPVLRWAPVANAKHYRVQVARDSAFGLVAVGIVVPGTEVQLPLLPPGTKFWWRVRAGWETIEGPWSEVWNFTTEGIALGRPVLSEPPKGAVGVSRSPTLRWHPVERAAGYWVQVARNDGFTVEVIARRVTTTSLALSGLPAGTKFWWRVRAYAEGGEGPWSEAWNFTTRAE